MTILSFFDLISHPDRSLEEHLEACDRISQLVLNYKHISDKFYPKSRLEELRRLLVYFHDFGKGTDFFQYKIIKVTLEAKIGDFIETHQEYIAHFRQYKWSEVETLLLEDEYLSTHAKLGAYWVFSNFSDKDAIVEGIILRIIRKHHGNLTNFFGKADRKQILLQPGDIELLEKQIERFNFDNYNKILLSRGYQKAEAIVWETIKNKFNDPWELTCMRKVLQQNKSLKYFVLQHFLFSLLLSADKGDMMLTKDQNKTKYIRPNRLVPLQVIDHYKAQKFKSTAQKPIDIQREQAYQDILANVQKEAHQHFFSITLPTGLGKTLSAYNAAITLQQKYHDQTGCAPRIIYCLPFTSIIDQNSQILEEIFALNQLDQDFVTTHHYLSHYKDTYNQLELKNDEPEYLTAGWEQEVVVTTFVQLLESIFTNRNRALRKFHNMLNAIIILDEVQNIPPKYYRAIECIFRAMADYFNTKFMFVTATQPFLFENEADIIELTDPEKHKTKTYFTNLDRISLDQSLLVEVDYKPQDLAHWLPIFQADISQNPDQSFLFIFNTIAHSQEAYRTLKKCFPDISFIYLSSGILPFKRKQLIEKIKINSVQGIRQVVVSTQVVEAGVDIDLDIVYRDLAPIDGINQSAGRCNRNGIKGKGLVKLFHTGKAKTIYDGVLLASTEEILKRFDQEIAERELYELNRDYAEKIRKKITEKSDESETLIRAMQTLELEDIQDNFKLIKQPQIYHNVFIPCDEKAKKIWQQYRELMKIEDDFARKRAIKQIKPELLQYVTKFPKEEYKVEEERYLIYEKNWDKYYSLETGFIAQKKTKPSSPVQNF